ncbi:MAG: hypothetical protein PUJ57_00690, partial [Peptoniphilaceae bacterium]|nr:hypothetical protein [Peptoniphilaceae bacterium]MDY6085248.1 hypothetical protein [Peptoniphilaceae bacterium]
EEIKRDPSPWDHSSRFAQTSSVFSDECVLFPEMESLPENKSSVNPYSASLSLRTVLPIFVCLSEDSSFRIFGWRRMRLAPSSCGERRGSAVRHTFCLLFLKSCFSREQKTRAALATLESVYKRQHISHEIEFNASYSNGDGGNRTLVQKNR